MNSISLSTRLGLGFGAILTTMVAVSVLGVTRMASTQAALDDIVQVNNVQYARAMEMRLSTNRVAALVRNLGLMTDEKQMAAEFERLPKLRADYANARAELARLYKHSGGTPQEMALLARIDQLQERTQPLIDKAAQLGLQNKAEETLATLLNEVLPVEQEWLRTIGELTTLIDQLNRESAQEAAASYRNGRLAMVGGTLLALLMGIGAAVGLTRSVVRQLGGEPQYAAEVVRRIAQGDLSAPVRLRSGDRDSLLAAMQEMQQSLLRIVGDIRAGSDSIATGASQIATGNADLSQRTEEQASNLQQTAASMEQLNATVKNNADTARQAAQLASSASQVAGQGGEVVGQVVSTMDDITESSRRIADIISVIDGIAFQTNILALNAAVEAAR
ncbi:MAG: methyl-accepting chemotaxis protein, partial [Aquincola tertiaricarbonis]